jgi:hypothetical protein
MKLTKMALVCLIIASSFAAAESFDASKDALLTISNEQVVLTVDARKSGKLSVTLAPTPEWAAENYSAVSEIVLDGGFALNLMWTGWSAPGFVNNAENPVTLHSKDFELVGASSLEPESGDKEISLDFKFVYGIEVRLTFKLNQEGHFVRQHLAMRDTRGRNHFLRYVVMMEGTAHADEIIKEGGFGNPVAFLSGHGGAFIGIETPLATSTIDRDTHKVASHQVIGEKLGPEWQSYEPMVIGLSPNKYVKLWFKRYLESVKVSPAKPYLLYNTWYDVRAPEYVDRPEDAMSEKTVMRIINDFKRELYEKRGVKLDAFILDDGWDIYKSDWVLRPEEFPNGLAPIAKTLKELGTDLGIWFGPTGGYSNRSWRIEWMRANGYETVNDQFCLAGTKYKDLLINRTTDFVKNHGVRAFKWDGIQFSCSEPDHGHATGIYSRREVMNAVIELCEANRAIDPEVHLNITSGTWLSPWWLQYANQIWMQGRDYGYANVPSISKRDSAITYRDVVLYTDFIKQNAWFPISHLMTHGIIKGHLQKLGGEKEPLDKFTDNALLYFARGVSMYELYISPNLLTDGEWDAIVKSIRWAKDRFKTLKQTEMIGGDPGNGETYGYAHYTGKHGIVALRNPSIEKQTISFELAPAHGLDVEADDLVIDRVYPTRYIMPDLYRSGSTVTVELDGFETAVFEVYPLNEADVPLVTDTEFFVRQNFDKTYIIRCYNRGPRSRLLNPQVVENLSDGAKTLEAANLRLEQRPVASVPVHGSVSKITAHSVEIKVEAAETPRKPMLAVLLRSKAGGDYKKTPVASFDVNGVAVEPEITEQKGGWAWLKVDLQQGSNVVRLSLTGAEEKEWFGTLQAWSVYYYEEEGDELNFTTKNFIAEKPMPPRAWRLDLFRGEVKLGETQISAPAAIIEEPAEGK